MTLLEQQRALLDALFAWPAQDATKKIAACAMPPWVRGLKAYQTNGHMLAERALASAYPVLVQLLGEESFADLARALWHAHPPTCGDIAQWGEAMAQFVQVSPQLQDTPYLADVVRAEWALHRCAAASDLVRDLSTLALLTTHDPQQLRFGLAPGCVVLRSAWPVASILSAHREKNPSLQALGTLVRQGVAQDALIWRDGLRPRVREATAGETEFLSALLRGCSVAQALDAAPELDFSLWLPMAVQSALVLGVCSI